MQVILGYPTPGAYSDLRQAVGWEPSKPDETRRAFERTSHAVSICDNERLCVFGRIVGDGELYNYVQHLMVAPDAQGQGLGATVVKTLQNALEARTPNTFCGLLAIPGREGFYRRLGFVEQEPQNIVMELPPGRKIGA